MSCCAASLASPELMQETAARMQRIEDERILASSVELGGGRYKTDFIVPGMHCAGCIGKLERGLNRMEMVEDSRANLSLKTVSVVWSHKSGNAVSITEQIKRLGFDCHMGYGREAAADDNQEKSLLLALAVAGFAAANIMLLSVSVWSGADSDTARLFHLISGMIALPAVAYSGRPFFLSAAKALSSGSLNMDVPISLAVLLALGMSIFESMNGGEHAYFDASVTLLFFLLIGRYLDQSMRQKARSAVERLHFLSAKDGVLVGKKGELANLPLDEIKPGMKLRVFPGERFPVNGRILAGSTDLDRSHVTGESMPLNAKTGDIIEAGTLNLTSSVDIVSLSGIEDSFLGEMRKMITVAEHGRGNYTRIADRMARIYAPVVHALALITFIVWMMISGGEWQLSLYTAIAVLIITCPCALGLAVPVAHVVAANRLMKNGIMMRDGTALERLAETESIIFDKTGTLTTQNPRVTSVIAANELTIGQTKTMASKSLHPSARAVAHFLESVDEIALDEITEIPGAGIQAVQDRKTMRFGKPEWVYEIASDRPAKASKASVCFASSGEPATCFVIGEKLRKDAKQAVNQLVKQGFDVDICSGDNREKVSRIADKLALDSWLAGQTPSEKIEHVKMLKRQGKKSLMVGDGINDAPALAAGHVSMVPASASEIGKHSADFVFIRQSLKAVPFALDTAMLTARIVRQNFGLAIAYNSIAIPLAMAGYVTPLIAALAMSSSSIVVVANSLRIGLTGRPGNFMEPDNPATDKPSLKEARA